MNIFKNCICILLIITCSGCGRDKTGISKEYYRSIKIQANCGDLFNGIIYRMDNDYYDVYPIEYQNEQGQKIKLPKKRCVFIVIGKVDK